MLITTIEELRLHSPAHALDTIDGMVGFIDNSEHEFLQDKLGTPLYEALCRWYDENPVARSSVEDYQTGYYNRLLLLAQRCIAFDALGRAIGMQVVSVNNAGVNQLVVEDYEKPTQENINTYRDTCRQEAHAALNRLLQTLEQWTKETPLVADDDQEDTTTDSQETTTTDSEPTAADVSDASPSGATAPDAEKKEIVELWRHSRYFYLAASLLIPSAQVLQQYLNIYDSREKFIQMLPDLGFIQEEIIAPAIGEDFCEMLVTFATTGELPTTEQEGTTTVNIPTLQRTVHRLRKVMAALLVGRTDVLRTNKERKIAAHDDGVRMMQTAITYIRNNQSAYPAEVFQSSPLYVAPETETAAPAPSSTPCCCKSEKSQQEPRVFAQGDPAAWTPPLF